MRIILNSREFNLLRKHDITELIRPMTAYYKKKLDDYVGKVIEVYVTEGRGEQSNALWLNMAVSIDDYEDKFILKVKSWKGERYVTKRR